MIHLGYETGTGKPVGIPLAHMAVTGQTQQSGKTTTMEALIDRGDLCAVVFITKPGEKSFSEGRRILPFFRERADWEYVKELLEARRNESLSKWDGYLMRVCRRARTLQNVRDNVASELPKKKSARPSHYEVLAGYLDLIIPELERVPYADKLDLRPGVNIMDLTGSHGEGGIRMSDDMQQMVLRSTIEEIHKARHNTVLVLPEAWKFIPEGGRSSVFQALHALIREGATNGNFVWIDAQDLAIVSKRILKSVTVWVLGKQQEANEVARTINHLIEPLHIRPDMIKSLGIGQFLVCGEGATRKVYVQPRWLGELDALAIARGEESVETAQAIWRQKVREAKRQGGREHAPHVPIPEIVGSTRDDRRGSGRGISLAEAESGTIAASDLSVGTMATTENEDESMWKEKYDALEAEHQTLIQIHDAMAARMAKIEQSLTRIVTAEREKNPHVETAAMQFVSYYFHRAGEWTDEPPLSSANTLPTNGESGRYDLNYIYDEIIRRAREEPGILQLLVQKPELRVQVEKPVLEVDGKSLRGGLALLIHKGFFTDPKNGNMAFNELQRMGRKVAKPNVYRELENLAELGFLTKEPNGYLGTDLKVSVAK